MIITAIAHDVGADLGRAYNEVMRRARDDDWVCFVDHDAVFTTRTWYQQLCEAVEEHPEAGLFGVMTNRVGNPEQEILLDVARGGRDNHDMRYHRKIGAALAEDWRARDRERKQRASSTPPSSIPALAPVAPPPLVLKTAEGSVIERMPEHMELTHSNSQNWLCGVVMLTSKRAWSQVERGGKIGFPEGYFMGLDNFYHRFQKQLGNPVFLLTRVYVYHWYRADGDDAHVPEGDGRRSYRG